MFNHIGKKTFLANKALSSSTDATMFSASLTNVFNLSQQNHLYFFFLGTVFFLGAAFFTAFFVVTFFFGTAFLTVFFAVAIR